MHPEDYDNSVADYEDARRRLFESMGRIDGMLEFYRQSKRSAASVGRSDRVEFYEGRVDGLKEAKRILRAEFGDE